MFYKDFPRDFLNPPELMFHLIKMGILFLVLKFFQLQICMILLNIHTVGTVRPGATVLWAQNHIVYGLFWIRIEFLFSAEISEPKLNDPNLDFFIMLIFDLVSNRSSIGFSESTIFSNTKLVFYRYFYCIYLFFLVLSVSFWVAHIKSFLISYEVWLVSLIFDLVRNCLLHLLTSIR